VYVCAVPASCAIVCGLAPDPDFESEDVHLRDVIALPPLSGSDQESTSCALTEDVAATDVGAPGTVVTVTGDAETAEAVAYKS